MDKRIRVRGIIIEDDEVYAIFRRKIRNNGVVKEYYVIPGGGMKNEETKTWIKRRTVNRYWYYRLFGFRRKGQLYCSLFQVQNS